MKERPAELIIRWWRQPAGQHKLTEIHYVQRWSRGNKARVQGHGHKINSAVVWKQRPQLLGDFL